MCSALNLRTKRVDPWLLVLVKDLKYLFHTFYLIPLSLLRFELSLILSHHSGQILCKTDLKADDQNARVIFGQVKILWVLTDVYAVKVLMSVMSVILATWWVCWVGSVFFTWSAPISIRPIINHVATDNHPICLSTLPLLAFRAERKMDVEREGGRCPLFVLHFTMMMMTMTGSMERSYST